MLWPPVEAAMAADPTLRLPVEAARALYLPDALPASGGGNGGLPNALAASGGSSALKLAQAAKSESASVINVLSF